MIRVRCNQSGGDIDVWINPKHVVKCWRRLDNVTMLRFINGETMQVYGTAASMAQQLGYDQFSVSVDNNNDKIVQAIKEQTRQLHHLNLLVEAMIRINHPGVFNSAGSPHVPSVPYY